MLKTWLFEHRDNPYPTEQQKDEFCRVSNLHKRQITHWFTNARKVLPSHQSSHLLP